MIKLCQMYIVNGQRTEITTECHDVSQTATALAMIGAAAAQIGGTPEPPPAYIAAATAAAPTEPARRPRRTKAEIEADAARETAAATPPTLPPGMGAPSAPISQAFAPASVELSAAPMPMPPTSEAVTIAPPSFAGGIAPPPSAPPVFIPPTPSPEEMARADVTAAADGLIALVPSNWADSVRTQVQSILASIAGGNISVMTVDEAKRAEAGILAYRQKCMEALAAR